MTKWILVAMRNVYLPALGWHGPGIAATLRVPSEYATINMALDASAADDTVLVAAGTYTQAEERIVSPVGIPYPLVSLAFLKDGVTLRSEGGSAVTVLDLEGQASTWGYGSVLIAANLPSLNTKVVGFSITGAPLGNQGAFVAESGRVRFEDCVFHDLDSRGFLEWGGGIAITYSRCEFLGCIFRDCAASFGGGIAFGVGPSLFVEDCIFERCTNGGVTAEDGQSFNETVRDFAKHAAANGDGRSPGAGGGLDY